MKHVSLKLGNMIHDKFSQGTWQLGNMAVHKEHASQGARQLGNIIVRDYSCYGAWYFVVREHDSGNMIAREHVSQGNDSQGAWQLLAREHADLRDYVRRY